MWLKIGLLKGKFIIIMSIISILTLLSGCTRFVDSNDKKALKEDFGFISEGKSDREKEKQKNEKAINNKKNTGKDKVIDNKVDKIDKEEEEGSSTNYNGISKEHCVSKYDVEKMLNGTYEGPLTNQKMVFLTFDDGPSNNTIEILKVLNSYDVKGTFFVLGSAVKANPEYLKRTYDAGNAIGNHTFNHSYNKIYPNNEISVAAYMEEYYKTEEVLRSVLGENFKSNLIRMPGGEMSRAYYKDVNLSVFKDKLKDEKIASIDWNALNGDAEGKNYSVNELIEYTKKSSEGKDHVILLMHDTEKKYLTVRALPEIIEYFKNKGYSFKIMI